MSKFLLLLGPSGVGKSATIDKLCRLDDRFVYISPFTTRPLRKGEKNKISITSDQMEEMWNRGEILVINDLYGIRYATPIKPIMDSLVNGRFPILDWPVSQINLMKRAFPTRLHIVYISPPSIKVLRKRLTSDKRDVNGSRLQNACKELKAYWSHQYDGICDLKVISKENQLEKIAHAIYISFIKSMGHASPNPAV